MRDRIKARSLILTECLLDEPLQGVIHVGLTRRRVLDSRHNLLLDGVDHKQQTIWRRRGRERWERWFHNMSLLNVSQCFMNKFKNQPYSVLSPHSFTLLASYWAFFFKRQALKKKKKEKTTRQSVGTGGNAIRQHLIFCFTAAAIEAQLTWTPACSSLCGSAVVQSAAARSPASGRWSPCSVYGAPCRSAATCADWESSLPRLCGVTFSTCTFLKDVNKIKINVLIFIVFIRISALFY